MLHLIAWALPGTLLFRTWAEGLACFDSFVHAFPDLDALCVMPLHVHVQGDWPDGERRLAHAESGFARRRFAMRGKQGPAAAFARHPEPSRVAGDEHKRRTIRYIHLNPCRDDLIECPLAWPLSTHRDRVGLTAFPVAAPRQDRERFHKFVSSDFTTAPDGTPLPELRRRTASMNDVIDAVSATARVLPEALHRSGRARTLAVETAWMAGIRDTGQIATAFSISPRAVRDAVAALPDSLHDPLRPALVASLRALGDPRFERLDSGILLRRPSWASLRGYR